MISRASKQEAMVRKEQEGWVRVSDAGIKASRIGDCESEENGKARIPRDRNWLPSRPFSEAYIAHVRVSICVIMRQYSMEYKNG